MIPIAITERLPDPLMDEEVLVYDTAYNHWFFAVLRMGEHYDPYWRSAEGLVLIHVSHWMPEPPPPQ